MNTKIESNSNDPTGYFAHSEAFGKALTVGLIGPSGCGKTTALKIVINQYANQYTGWEIFRTKNTTTRSMREGESNYDYNFDSLDKFLDDFSCGLILESNGYKVEGVEVPNFYGLHTQDFQPWRNKDVRILTLDFNGALKFSRNLPKLFLPILVCPEDPKIVEQRLRSVKREDRIATMYKEHVRIPEIIKECGAQWIKNDNTVPAENAERVMQYILSMREKM